MRIKNTPIEPDAKILKILLKKNGMPVAGPDQEFFPPKGN